MVVLLEQLVNMRVHFTLMLIEVLYIDIFLDDKNRKFGECKPLLVSHDKISKLVKNRTYESADSLKVRSTTMISSIINIKFCLTFPLTTCKS